jgi:hypothetical protein
VTRTTIVIAVALAALATAAAPAPASPAGKTQVCGQRQGPSTAWSDTLPGLGTYKFKGNTWTVFATDVSCPFALQAAPGLLAQWSKAKIGGRLTLPGWLCTKEKASAYSGKGTSSGSVGCVGKKAAFIAIWMYAPYTLAQIKQVAATGKLPSG